MLVRVRGRISQPEIMGMAYRGRVNLLSKTEQFDDAAWTKSQVSVAADTVMAPSGAQTADQITESAVATVQHSIRQTVAVVSGVPFTESVYAKSANRNIGLRLRAHLTTANEASAVFNPTTGAITVLTPTGWASPVCSAELVGDFYRFSMTVIPTETATIGCDIFITNSTSLASYTGDGVSGATLWGAQLVRGASALAYQRVA